MKAVMQIIREKLQLCIMAETEEEKLLMELFQTQIGVKFESEEDFRQRRYKSVGSISRRTENTMLEIKPFPDGVIVREKMAE